MTTIGQRLTQTVFSAEDLDGISNGTFLHTDTPQLPGHGGVGWRLFRQVTIISDDEGTGGELEAVGNIELNHPIFQDHFPSFKVLPGLYMADQLLQLTGLMMGLRGVRGQGLAMETGETKFIKAATPEVGQVTFKVKGTKFQSGKLQSKQWADGQWFFGDILSGSVKGLHVKIVHPRE